VQVVANGKPYEVEPGLTVEQFVRLRGLDPQLGVVERNGEALGRAGYETTALEPGDRLELVRAVAGGWR
jgi:sulfur carrier protein